MQDIEQLRRDLEDAVAELGPDARRVWDAIEEGNRRLARGEEVPAELPPGYDALPPSEQDALIRAVQASADLHGAEAEEEEGMVSLMRQGEGVIRKARELEPAAGDDLKLGEAVAILRRHGVNPGISPELEGMVVEVPVEEPTPFGSCPECGKSDAYRNIHRLHFFYCDEHRLTWCVGSNLMSSWREESEEDWRSAWEHLKGYRTVDGFGRYAPGPPLEELTTLKKLLANR